MYWPMDYNCDPVFNVDFFTENCHYLFGFIPIDVQPEGMTKFCNSFCVSRNNNVAERHQLIHVLHNKNILLHWSSQEWECLKRRHWFRRFEKKFMIGGGWKYTREEQHGSTECRPNRRTRQLNKHDLSVNCCED